MADYNTVMAQLQQQAQQAAQDRMAALLATGQYIPLEGGSLWNVAREQAVTKDQVLGDALVPAMQAYVAANPNDPAAQQMQNDLTQMQAAAHKGDFGSFIHGLATRAALTGGITGFGVDGMSLGQSWANSGLQGGGPMLGEGVMGPPVPGGNFFTGPPTPVLEPLNPNMYDLSGQALPGFDQLTPRGLPPVQDLPGTNGPLLPTVPGTTETILPNSFDPAAPIPSGLPPVQNIPGQNKPLLPTTPGTTNTILPGDGTIVNSVPGVSGLTKAINDIFGTNLSDSDLQTLGKFGAAGLSLLGANQAQGALTDIYNQQKAERAPALNAFNNMLNNPNEWYSSAPAMGATDAILRKLSVNGNPAGNPGDLSKAAAYNLGGYNQMLGTLGSLGLSGQATTANLGTQLAQVGQVPYNIGANLIGQVTTPQQNSFDEWMKEQQKYGTFNTPGTRSAP